jgi:hypothetical protein
MVKRITSSAISAGLGLTTFTHAPLSYLPVTSRPLSTPLR